MKIAITGMGMVSCAGSTAEESFQNLCAGKPLCRELQAFDRTAHVTTTAFEILDREDGRDRTLRATNWLLTAIEQAIQTANLTDADLAGMPVLIGTGLRELRSAELWQTEHQDFAVPDLNFSNAVYRRWPQLGAVITSSNACSAGTYMLAMAHDCLESGQCERAIVAGADSITQSMIGLVDRCNPLSPIDALRPFDVNRRGVLLGEGAAALILETPSSADLRGASPLATLSGVGINCDGHHETAPDIEGVLQAFRLAHDNAGTNSTAIDLLIAHGTGTHLNDQTEAAAIVKFFGEERAKTFSLTAIKSIIGHTSGGSGLMSAVVGILAMHKQIIPPIAGLEHPIADAQKLDLVLRAPRQRSVERLQVNSFGFGGVNAVALFEKAQH